jgi:hypothetical protein
LTEVKASEAPALPDDRETKSRRSVMTHPTDGTRVPPHGLFHMENAGGHPAGQAPPPVPPAAPNGHQPGCFALEEEKGEGWKGSGASGPAIKETRPSL